MEISSTATPEHKAAQYFGDAAGNMHSYISGYVL